MYRGILPLKVEKSRGMSENNGQFKKGKTKTGGRTKGTPNKVNGLLKEKLSNYIEENFETILEDVQSSRRSDRIKFYLKIMEYVLPKAKPIEPTTEAPL